MKRPGVAPCEGHFEIYGRKWQRQLIGFGVGPEKTTIVSQKFIIKTCNIPLSGPEDTGNNFVLHTRSAKPTCSW